MCFDCSNFQYQLDKTRPKEDHVYQTIFLNNKDEKTWSKHEISKDKISKHLSSLSTLFALRAFPLQAECETALI
jgi:hypothetical protein